MSGVLKEWVIKLPLMMQGTLMTGIRGNDLHLAPNMKPLARWLRSLVLINGNPENDFMDVPDLPKVEDFEDELEYMTMHYFLHFLHCLEIVGYKHPDKETQITALDYYDRLVDWCHLLPEPEEHIDFRLSGKPGSTGTMRKWRSGSRMSGKVLESLQIRALQRQVDDLSNKLLKAENAYRESENLRERQNSHSFGRDGS